MVRILVIAHELDGAPVATEASQTERRVVWREGGKMVAVGSP